MSAVDQCQSTIILSTGNVCTSSNILTAAFHIAIRKIFQPFDEIDARSSSVFTVSDGGNSGLRTIV